jgi:hypothetical protein
LTADGTLLATASTKGTILRVFDVASATCLKEFRRGVERASITCLAWSWDAHWLACSSDKGTTHIFHLDAADEETTSPPSALTSSSSASYTQMFLAAARKSMESGVDSKKKSVYQVRGVPHPQACAFVADAKNVLAVAGWDADGNGVLMLVEFDLKIERATTMQYNNAADLSSNSRSTSEPRRIGYHVLCRSNITRDETEEARRRRRLRGWTPEIPETPEGGRLYVGERLEVLERGMEQIYFEETDEFVSVTTSRPGDQSLQQPVPIPAPLFPDDDDNEHGSPPTSPKALLSDSQQSAKEDAPSPTSIRTEPLEDEPSEKPE